MAGSTPISEDTLSLTSTPAIAPPKTAAEQDLWIFRDGKRAVSGPDLLTDLGRRISACVHGDGGVLDCLIQAGELEAGLADAGSHCASTAQELTDVLASSFLDGNLRLAEVQEVVKKLEPPSTVEISPPEGFTYYGLHPIDFANVIGRIPEDPESCAIIGIRSIGATLSAIVLAALRTRRRPTSRITVRPTGHPYSRSMQFNSAQLDWIHQNLTQAAQFLVVDEGPGRSGSTFLSVAEALCCAGVPRERITLLGSREPDPDSLCATDASVRWSSFRFLAVSPSSNGRFQNFHYAGGGDWRRVLLSEQEDWPESWTQMERPKFISPDGRALYKFEGMGPIGARVRVRALQLAEAGFGPAARDAGDGFVAYSLLRGQRLQSEDVSTTLLDRIADYCVYRQSNFAVRTPEPSQLLEMLQFNLSQEFGISVPLPEDAFSTECPVIVDGRMMPHEWIATGPDQFVKIDSVDHGDNHFFPGPCDIAWDVAGIAIEWQLDTNAVRYLLDRLNQKSHFRSRANFSLYILAYCVFRLGFCKMAISTVKGSPEEVRLRSAYRRYRARAQQLLEPEFLRKST